MQSAISNDQQVEPTSGFLVETNMPTSGFKRNIAEVYRLAGQALPAHHISKDDSDCDLVPVFVGIIKDGMELREVCQQPCTPCQLLICLPIPPPRSWHGPNFLFFPAGTLVEKRQ